MNQLNATFNHCILLVFILIKAIIMPISLVSCDNVNLTAITWEHAVNSQAKLEAALNGSVSAIEADVIMGWVGADNSLPDGFEPVNVGRKPDTDGKGKGDKSGKGEAQLAQGKIPVMGHSKGDKIDLSLEEFLKKAIAYNTKDENKDKQKSFKLDFKSIDAAKESIKLLGSKDYEQIVKNVWVNADILKGPGGKAPVDPVKFIDAAKELKNVVLSIGWTTEWSENLSNATYTKENVEAMIKVITDTKIHNMSHPITFPIRAVYAASSKESLDHLYNEVKKINGDAATTLTIWSGKDDKVDAKALQEFIKGFGIDKVYVDVPIELRNNMNLGKNSASSLIHFGVLNLITFAVVHFLRNGMH